MCSSQKRSHYTNRHGTSSRTPCLNWLLCRAVPAKSSLNTGQKFPGLCPNNRVKVAGGGDGKGSVEDVVSFFFLDRMPLLIFKKLPFVWNPPARRVPVLSTEHSLLWGAELPQSSCVPSRYSQAEEGTLDLPDPPCRAESNSHPCACALQGYSLFYWTFCCKLLHQCKIAIQQPLWKISFNVGLLAV